MSFKIKEEWIKDAYKNYLKACERSGDKNIATYENYKKSVIKSIK